MARYDSMLIRVWRSGGEGCTQWSAQLRHFQGQEAIRFAHPDALLAHLRTLVYRADHGDHLRVQSGGGHPPRGEPRIDDRVER